MVDLLSDCLVNGLRDSRVGLGDCLSHRRSGSRIDRLCNRRSLVAGRRRLITAQSLREG